MSKLPWYKEGLNFKCTECGKCCTGNSGFVWLTNDEMKMMACHLNLTEQAFKIKYVRMRENRMALTEKKNPEGGFSCVFLDGNKCGMYQYRPQQCRTFPWWKENLNSPESWKLAAESCEGINESAEKVPLEVIEKNLKLNN